MVNTVPAFDKKNNARSYNISDLVCCEVVEVNPDTDKMIVTMKSNSNTEIKFGAITADSLPLVYK